MPDRSNIGLYTFIAIYCVAIGSIGTWITRDQTFALMPAYFSAFVAYIFILQRQSGQVYFLSLGIVSRLVLFFSMPTLSDDVYRFIWDGTLLQNGIHPFESLPHAHLGKGIPGISEQLYGHLNSPNYFTVYPPLNQLFFWLGTLVGPGDWLVTTNVLRLALLGADIGSYFLLRKLLSHLNKPLHLANWYFLNPLVILEFTGNLHFEGLVIFGVLLGIHFFEQKKIWPSAMGFAMAIGTKLLPLIYLPYLFLRGLKNRTAWVPVVAGMMAFLTFIPMLNESLISGMANSLDLYFRSFEFNASIYFIVRQIGFWLYGYNQIAAIGPILSIATVLLIIGLSLLAVRHQWSIPQTLLFILTSYLLMATTVHPWYVLPLIAFGILSGYWYPIVWSLLIFVTYSGYTESGFELPMLLVVIEYVITAIVMIFELRLKLSTQ